MSCTAAPSPSPPPSRPGHDTPAHPSPTWHAPSSVKADTMPAISGQCCDDGWNLPLLARRQGPLRRRPGRGQAAAGDLPAATGSGPGEPGVRDPGHHLGRTPGDRPVHRPRRRACRLPRPSTRPPGWSSPGPGSRTSTSTPWYCPMPGRCWPPATAWPPSRRTCATPRRVLARPGPAGRHRPGQAGRDHPRRGPALPGRRCRPGGDHRIRAADGTGQLPDHLLACYDDEALGKQLSAEYTAGHLAQPLPRGRGVVLRRTGTGGARRYRSADLAGVDARTGAAPPRGPRAGRRGARNRARRPRRRPGEPMTA